MSNAITSQRKKRKFVDEDSHVYVLNNSNKDETIQYWTCERKVCCRAKIHVSNDRIIRHVGEHTHGPNVDAVKANTLINDMVKQAETTQNSTRNIISSAVSTQEDGVLASLPSKSTISRRIQRARRRVNPCPPIPTARNGFSIPDSYTITTDGRRFLMYDSGVDDHERILIYSSDEHMDAMVRNTNWFIDGTFKCAPEIFYQVFTIHVLIAGNIIPVLYALLPNKQCGTYDRLFTAINAMRQFDPTTVMSDFEMASINAVQANYPRASITGCFFHFSQCIYRKVQEFGLQTDYRDPDFRLFIRMLAALAFVPTDRVIESFDTLLESHSPSTAQRVIDYFEDTFIGRPLRRNGRREPIIARNLWNVNSRVDDVLPRTNNSVEGWHRAFQSSLSCAHPSLWKLIDYFKREEGLQRYNIAQIMTGNAVCGRKKYRCLDARLRKIVNQYDVTSTMDYLKSIAHNLNF